MMRFLILCLLISACGTPYTVRHIGNYGKIKVYAEEHLPICTFDEAAFFLAEEAMSEVGVVDHPFEFIQQNIVTIEFLSYATMQKEHENVCDLDGGKACVFFKGDYHPKIRRIRIVYYPAWGRHIMAKTYAHEAMHPLEFRHVMPYYCQRKDCIQASYDQRIKDILNGESELHQSQRNFHLGACRAKQRSDGNVFEAWRPP